MVYSVRGRECFVGLSLLFIYDSNSSLYVRPNTEFHWSPEKRVEELRASRDIEEGEELTTAYLDLTAKVKKERQRRE